MNNTALLGRITKDPEVRTTRDGKPYCRFTLAVDRDKDRADFIPCVVWGANAENMGRYVKKGRQLLVQGRIQSGSYQDNQGTTRYTLDLFVYRVQFLAIPKGQQTAEKDPGFYPYDSDDSLPF